MAVARTQRGTAPEITAAPVRCAIYTRKSTEEGLDQEFNSLDAQREAAEAFIMSQRHEGWCVLPDKYDDGGFSGGTLERPALERLLHDVEDGKVDCIVVYKIDRLSRSLLDFTRLVDLFDRHGVTFVSVTQQFSTTTSMGRLTLNILLSFAQFEREIIGERIRDKVAAAKRKGMYMGGTPPLGYNVDHGNRRLVVNKKEAELVRHIFRRFIETQSPINLAKELNEQGHTTKSWTTVKGRNRRGIPWNKSHIYRLLANRTYLGEVCHKGNIYKGEHDAIVPREVWDEAHRILEQNTKSRKRSDGNKPAALLRGILRCGCCNCAMTVSSTRKNGRQYRYYVCLTAIKKGYDACKISKVSAGDIEAHVLDHLRALFQSPEVVAKTFRDAAALAGTDAPKLNEQQIALALSYLKPIWDNLFPGEQERIMRLLLDKVILHEGEIEIRVRADGLGIIAAELTQN